MFQRANQPSRNDSDDHEPNHDLHTMPHKQNSAFSNLLNSGK